MVFFAFAQHNFGFLLPLPVGEGHRKPCGLAAKRDHFGFFRSPETFIPGKQPERFHEIGFALCVFSENDIDAFFRLKHLFSEIAELLYLKAVNLHLAPRCKDNR